MTDATPHSPSLSWALVIATKDRLPVLQQCVLFALEQSRAPSEVVIIDASAEWDHHRQVITDCLQAHPDIRLHYAQAPSPSVSIQRNAGLAASTADIAFLIDDDSFLFPDAAETVMRTYEADKDQQLAGVHLAPSPAPPRALSQDIGTQNHTAPPKKHASSRWRRLTRSLLQYGLEARFIPYEKTYPDLPPPPHCVPPETRRERLVAGFRMTYRRTVAANIRFDPHLLYYCPGEDLDFSYRASQIGALVTANAAKVHHFTSSAGRLKRRQVTTLAALNQAVFLRKHASDQRWARRSYLKSMLHRAFGDVFRDLGAGDYHLPSMRGTLTGMIMAQRVFRQSRDVLEETYADVQKKIVQEVRG